MQEVGGDVGVKNLWGMKKLNNGSLGYIGDEQLPIYIGIIISHYKNPY